MRRPLIAALAVISFAHPTAAQTCRGLAPYAAGPVQVIGEGSLTPESNAVAAGLGYSLPRGFFADASVGTRSSNTFNGSTLELAAGVGYAIQLGRYQLCPLAAGGIGTGPSKPFGNGEDRSNRTAQLGLAAGVLAGSIARWQFVPTLALSYAYRQDAAHDYTGRTLFQISDRYALVQAGIGFVSHNWSVRPLVELPLSFESGDPSVRLTVGYNFGRRERAGVP
jgi:hypothetical protein